MSESEIMTIIIAFHRSHQRDFKNFYLSIIHRYHKNEFPILLSYTRFLEVMPSVLVPLSSFFTHLKGEPTGIESIDSTSIKVSHNLYIQRHNAFQGTAARGKAQWVGFMDLSFTSSRIIWVISLLPNSLPRIRTIESPSVNYQKGYSISFMQTKAISVKHLPTIRRKGGGILVTTHRKNMKPKFLAA